MKWFGSAIGFAMLVALAGWVFLLPSGEPDQSSVDSRPVVSSVEPEEAEEAVNPQRNTRPASEANASSDTSLAAALTPADGLSKKSRRITRPPEEEVTDTGLDELRKKIRAADALPAERGFLAGGHLDVGTSMKALGSDEFSKAIEELTREAYGDFDAQALSDVYSSYVGSFLEAGGGFALDRLVCGMRVCMGEALALSEGASWPHLGLYSSQYGGPPMFASAYDFFVTPEGMVIYQFLFTTDPESRGIVVHRP